MAETLKSALFVDYDSIHRSLAAAGRDGDALAQRTSAWVVAIESGRLVSAKDGDQNRRRFALRRCYADPARLGKNRIAFVAAGFELIDCPTTDGRKNSAGMSVALDVIEALAHPTAYEEFVLLSADTDLAPIIQRLHSLERAAVVYSGPATPPANLEAADGLVEEGKLASLLFADEAPAQRPAAPRSPASPAPAKPAAPAGSASRNAPPAMGERAEIEALARRIHSGTNIPLLSPRTFAELFRLLATEISERGYHFQETAERVSSSLTAAGRNVTRRQVVFVVKGLALKGHVFSTTDTAERLAEVFREQALYLIGNAGLELTDRERALLPAWISANTGAATAPAEPAPVSTTPQRVAADDTKAAKRKGPKPAADQKPETPAPAPETSPKPAQAKAPPPKAAEPARQAAPASPRQPQPKAQPRPAAPQRPAAPKPAARPAAKPTKEPANSEALESSILAAIAQAVDVLIEDGHAGTSEAPATPPPPRDKEPPAAPVEAQPDQPPSEGGESDDIGDEIQRIIASYSRARQQGES
jgi:hypothetical protein